MKYMYFNGEKCAWDGKTEKMYGATFAVTKRLRDGKEILIILAAIDAIENP